MYGLVQFPGQYFCLFPMFSEHLSQNLKYQNYLYKRQSIEKVTPLPQYPGSYLGPNLEKYIKGTSVDLLLTPKVKSHDKNSLLVWCLDLLKEETLTLYRQILWIGKKKKKKVF